MSGKHGQDKTFPDWSEFPKRAQSRGKFSAYRDRMCIIVLPNGQIVMTPVVTKELGYPTHVVIVYDTHAGLAGIKASDEDNDNAYKVEYHAVMLHAYISATAFTKGFNLVSRDNETLLYPCEFTGKVLSFSLRTPPDVIFGRKSVKQS